MKPLYDVLGTPAGLALLMIALALLSGQTVLFLLALRERKMHRQIRAAALQMLAGFLVFIVLLEAYDIVNYLDIPRNARHIGDFIGSLPWLLCAAAEAVSALVFLLHFLQYLRYRRNTVTSGAIRQSIDLLPEGLCVSAADGTVLLVNLKMDALCRALTGDLLSDARRFWAYLEENGEEQEGKRLVLTPQGDVWLFARDGLTIDGMEYERMSAVDVTERYRITEELRQKNAHLQEIRRRMKEAADLSAEMFVKQEEATARTALHNELGQVLLLGRYYIEHPETTDASMVALMTKQMNGFLLGESRAPESETEDDLGLAVDLAGSIGVTVEFQGEAPKEPPARSLLAAAIRECAVNCVKHAEGDRLFVRISESGEGVRITITNNGRPPKEPIAESGGLLSLRRSVEAAGGRMIVESLPVFCLSLSLPS